MNELNTFNSKVLKALGNEIDPKTHKIDFVLQGKKYPLRIDEKDMYLPTTEALSTGSDQKVYFHPTCENITSKETEVFKLIRRMAGIRLMTLFREMVVPLFDIASKPAKKSHNQKVRDTLAPLTSVKRNVRDDVFKLIAAMTVEIEGAVDNRFIHFKVTKGGRTSKDHGNYIYAKTSPSFPFYESLIRQKAQNEGLAGNKVVNVNDINVSLDAIEIAIHIFRFFVPTVLNPDACEFEALSPVASRFTAFMNCFAEIANEINRAQNMFRSDYDKLSIYPIDLSWQEMLEEIPDFYRQVASLDYNSHNVYKEGEQQNNALNNNMGNMLSMTSQQPVQNAVTPVISGVGAAIVMPNTVVTQTINPTDIRVINGENWNFTIPVMVNGDRYQRSEPNLMERRIYHHALDVQNCPVIYICSIQGNLIMRNAMGGQPNGYGPQPFGYQQPQPNIYGYQPQPNMYGYQQQPQPNMYQPAPPVTTQQPASSESMNEMWNTYG